MPIPMRGGDRPLLSIVIPVYNEVENLDPLMAELREVVASLPDGCEILLVDDGSTDGSREKVRSLAAPGSGVRAILLDRNHGQTAAFLAGFARARGDVVVTMDADLQNDPRDIGRLLAALPGHDAAIGVRERRHDTLARRLSSRIANRIRARGTGDPFTDVGCSLKAFRRDVVGIFPPYRGMHRFFATLAFVHGYSVVQVPVNHRHRHAGASKYGLGNRAFVAFEDLLAVRWMKKRLLRHRVAEEVGGGAGEGAARREPDAVSERA